MNPKLFIFSFLCFFCVFKIEAQPEKSQLSGLNQIHKTNYVDAADFGFSPDKSGIENSQALQKAVDMTGTIKVNFPGTYKMAGTVYIGSNTSIIFGNNVYLKKVDEVGIFTYLFLNKGALTKVYDENISLIGLNIVVNKIDALSTEVFGLRGQISFFYIKDLRIERFRCFDLAKEQFAIHVCTFEDLIVDDVIIKGDKDGVHLGRGKRFKICNAVFQTFDDAIALNAHDYATSNPELGWIENGVIENCHDLNAENTTGYFCRILAGAWINWKPGMQVRRSDAVVSNGRIYRVQAKVDGRVFKSITQPVHESGSAILDSINWVMIQQDTIHTAGVRNVVFRDIFLEKPRIGFSVHFDNDNYSRSYYPGASIPIQEQLTFENIRVLYNQPKDFLSIGTPVDVLTISNSSFRNNAINFHGNKAMPDYLKTRINIYGCVFNFNGCQDLVTNSIENKEIFLKTSSNIELFDNFSAKVLPGSGKITVESDLTGLKNANRR